MLVGVRKGFSIVSVVLGVAVVTISYIIYTQSSKLLSQQSKALTDGLVAEMYATELLELLRSFSDENLRRYISVHPQDPRMGNPIPVGPCGAACTPPPFCTRFNESPPFPPLFPNAIADLPPNSPLAREDSPPLAPNRWFMVQLVDLAAPNLVDPTQAQIEVLSEYCAGSATPKTPKQIDLPDDPTGMEPGNPENANPDPFGAPPTSGFPLPVTTRLLITVGVSWVPKGKMTNADRKGVVLSTIIPSDRT